MPTLPDGTTLWWYITAMTLGVMLLGIAKSGFGGGIGIITVPLIANALPADRTIGVMLPILIFADLFAVAAHRKHVDRPTLRWLLIGAAIGIAIGTAVIWLIKTGGTLDFALNLIVGSVCIVFVMLQCFRMLGGHVPHVPGGPLPGTIAGTAAGSVSMIAHSAGPVISIYLLERKLPKILFVGTSVIFFFIVNLAKVPSYVGLGLINRQTLVESAIWLPVVPVGAWIGIKMLRRIPEKPFTFIIYAAAALAGGRMIYKAFV